MRWNLTEEIFLKSNYEFNGSKYCSDKLNRSESSVRSKARYLGLNVDGKVISKLRSKNRVDYNNFKNVLNSNYSYILGLLWSDGTVGFANNNAKTPQIKHTCVYYDSDCFNEIFKKTGDWGNYTFENKKSIGKNEMSANWTSNRELGEYLIENDYRNKSASPNKILNTIPDEYKNHFYRGFFDGDGCITSQSIKNKYKSFSIYFSGEKNQDWSFLSNLFDNMNIKYKIRKLKDDLGESSQIYIWRHSDLIKFCEYIYLDNDNSYLKRKYDKYIELLEYDES